MSAVAARHAAGDQIDAAMILARTDFVSVLRASHRAGQRLASSNWLDVISVALAGLHPPFRFVHAEDEKPQGERVFGDEGDPQNVGEIRPLEEKPEAVDPIDHSGKHHQQAEQPRQELRLENERPNQRAEYAKEYQANAEAIGPEPDRCARERLSLLSVKGVEVFRERECDLEARDNCTN